MANPLGSSGGTSNTIGGYTHNQFSTTQQQKSPGVRTPINLPNQPALGSSAVGGGTSASFQLFQQRDAIMSKFF